MCEEPATNERQKKTFVSGSEPALAGERAGWNRDGLRAEYSKRTTGAVPARRARTRRVCLGTRALQGLSAGSEELRFERVRDKINNDATPSP
jgi:hypothetical protein